MTPTVVFDFDGVIHSYAGKPKKRFKAGTQNGDAQ